MESSDEKANGLPKPFKIKSFFVSPAGSVGSERSPLGSLPALAGAEQVSLATRTLFRAREDTGMLDSSRFPFPNTSYKERNLP